MNIFNVLVSASCLLAAVTSCGPEASRSAGLSSAATSAPTGLDLNCRPRPVRTALVGSVKGSLTVADQVPGGYLLQGPVTLTTKVGQDAPKEYRGTLSGIFTPGDRRNHFRTNYLDGHLSGAAPLSGATISLWPETEDFSFSAIYDAGGYRFAMDCSSSRLRVSL